MPELPEVEAVMRKVRKKATGAIIKTIAVFRPRACRPQKPEDLEKAHGAVIRKVERTGKNILLRLDLDLVFRVHLGMTGNLYVIPDARMHTAHVRVLLTLKDGRGLVLEDARLFGCLQLHKISDLPKVLGSVGIDPLSRAFTFDAFATASKRSRKAAKVFLMDQHPFAGLGNIYAAEALFEARIHPERQLSTLKKDRLQRLHSAIPNVLKRAVKHTVRSYSEPGFMEDMDYFVYGREGESCRVCGTAIKRFPQAGRSTFFCPKCQRS